MVRKRRHVNLSLHFSPSLHFPTPSPFPFHFLVCSPFALHFLILSPFSRKPLPSFPQLVQACNAEEVNYFCASPTFQFVQMHVTISTNTLGEKPLSYHVIPIWRTVDPVLSSNQNGRPLSSASL